MSADNCEPTAASIRCEPSDGQVRNLLRAPVAGDCEQPIVPRCHKYRRFRHGLPSLSQLSLSQLSLKEGDKEVDRFCADLEELDKEGDALGGALQMLKIGADFPLGPTGSGSLGGTPFTSALITLTANADTANVSNSFSGQLFLVNNASTTVDVAGIGPGIFTEVITTSVYHPNQTAGISDPSAGILDVVNPVFATYHLTTFVGPVSGSAHCNIGLVFPTTAGNFEVDS